MRLQLAKKGSHKKLAIKLAEHSETGLVAVEGGVEKDANDIAAMINIIQVRIQTEERFYTRLAYCTMNWVLSSNENRVPCKIILNVTADRARALRLFVYILCILLNSEDRLMLAGAVNPPKYKFRTLGTELR